MCGILGLYKNTVITPDDEQRFSTANAMLHRRGPDDSGIAAFPGLLFGHTRLAILDPASGRQPMIDRATGTALTYNGEIFNFRELRRELEQCGHAFHTHCDTEVVLHAWLQWGRECVTRFNGFFALAVFDPRRQELFCARDRFGIKPFYYAVTADGLAFSSAIPALLHAAALAPQPDFPAISHYLFNGRTVLDDQTLLRGVKALLPGRTMTLKLAAGSAPEIRRYWQLPRLTPEEKQAAPSFEAARDQIKAMLTDSIRKRLVSDVPLGSFLSGGLDSAIIATTAARFTDFTLPVFCAGSDDEKLNEYHYAEAIARQIGSPLHRISVNAAGFSADWDLLLKNKGLPLSTPNEISIFHLASELKKQCTVTLTGEGADEIFGGYGQPHFAAFDFDRCPREREEPESAFALAMTMLHGRHFFINDTDHYTSTSAWMSYPERQGLFLPDIQARLDDDNQLFAFYEDYFGSLDGLSGIDKRLHLHAEFNLENLLNRVDSSTMAASVEARVPFTDHEMAEFAFSLPDRYKLDWVDEQARQRGRDLTSVAIDREGLLATKRLPREAFRADLPAEIVNRPKMSFPVPYQKWFGQEMNAEITALCLESKFSRQYCRPELIKPMLARQDRSLWLTANLCRWWETISGS